MAKPGVNLQDSFLNQVRKEDQEVTVVMTNGNVLNGKVKGFDNFTVVLSTSDARQHLVYKHAIAQVIGTSQITHRSGEGQRARKDHGTNASAEQGVKDKNEAKQKEPFNKLDLSGVKINK